MVILGRAVEYILLPDEYLVCHGILSVNFESFGLVLTFLGTAGAAGTGFYPALLIGFRKVKTSVKK